MPKVRLAKHDISIYLVLLSLVFVCSLADAASTVRAGKWEGTIQLIGNDSSSSNGENGSSFDVESEFGIGGGIGYNFSNNFAITFDMSYIKPKYKAVYNTDSDGLVEIKHEMTVFNGQLNGVWNIVDGPFTPYLEGGIGWTYVDSNVADGPPTTGCWWDPWWGYVCRNFYSTYEETSFSYGFGGGLRYEFSNRMFLKGGLNRYYVDEKGDAADIEFDFWRLQVGWLF